jgi:hypothetical protein
MFVAFKGLPGDKRDTIANAIIVAWGGKVVAGGTMLIPPYERDLDVEIPARAFVRCQADLIAQGFRAEESL